MNEEKFDVIYADPPWKYDFSVSKARAIENHYETMKLEEIRDMKVPAKENAVLFLWSPPTFILKALKVMAAWGFTFVTFAVWDKQVIGMGFWFRAQHEALLVGRKGHFSPPSPANRVSSIIKARRKKHSEKPGAVYRIIEEMYPDVKRIELFARNKREGWAAWGNEVPSTTQQRITKSEGVFA